MSICIFQCIKGIKNPGSLLITYNNGQLSFKDSSGKKHILPSPKVSIENKLFSDNKLLKDLQGIPIELFEAASEKTSDYFKFSYKTAKKGFFGITKEAIQSTLKFSKPKNLHLTQTRSSGPRFARPSLLPRTHREPGNPS